MGTSHTLIVECAWRLFLDKHGVTQFNAAAPFVGVARIELGKAYALACACAEAQPLPPCLVCGRLCDHAIHGFDVLGYRFPVGLVGHAFERLQRVPWPFELDAEELKPRWVGDGVDFVRIARKVLESVDDTSLLALFAASHFVDSVTTFRDPVRVSLWSDQ